MSPATQFEATVESVAATVDKVRQSAIDEGLEESVVHLLADRIRDRAGACLSAIRPSARPGGQLRSFS